MSTTALDEELAEGLTQARKKPRNFALIAKGQKPLKLIVRKKPIRDGEVTKAKTEFKGNDAIRGVIVPDGAELEFQVVGDEPSIATVKLRAFITDKTELPIKLRWKIVKELAEVDEADEEGLPPVPPTTPGQQAPTTEDAAKQKLTAALMAIAPQMQLAMAANPGRSSDVLAAAGQVKTLLGENKLAEATAAFGHLAAVVKELLGGAGGESEQLEAEDEEESLLGSLFPDDDEDEKEAPAAESEEDIPVPPPVPVLSQEEAKIPLAPPPAAKAPSVGGRLVWQDAKEQVDINLSKLMEVLRQQDDPDLKAIGEYGFNAITGKLQVGLRAALMDYDKAGPEGRDKARQKALGIIEQYQQFLASNPLVALVDENIFGVPVEARRILGDALKELQASLQA